MRSSSDYRAMAKDNLKGNWGTAVVAVLLYGVIVGALSFTFIGSILVGGPLTVGLALFFIRLTRKNGEASVTTMFETFNNFVNCFVMYLLKGLFIFLWSLLFVIPGIIKTYSYAMSEYIMADDASVTATQAIDISKVMMNGKKWNLFCLQFSFIGWILIPVALMILGGILTAFVPGLGIVLLILSIIASIAIALLLQPYVYAATAAFYEDAKYEYFQSHNNQFSRPY